MYPLGWDIVRGPQRRANRKEYYREGSCTTICRSSVGGGLRKYKRIEENRCKDVEWEEMELTYGVVKLGS